MDTYSRRHGHHDRNAPPAGRGNGKDYDWELSVDKFLKDYPPRAHPSADLRTCIRGETRHSDTSSGRLYRFYCDKLKAKGEDWSSAEAMIRLWEVAGCDEQELQQKVAKERPRTREELRLVMMKIMGRIREDQIPREVNIGAMLDIAVLYFWDGASGPVRGGAEWGRGGTIEERGRGGTMEERSWSGSAAVSLEERQESLVPLQQFVMNAMSNSPHSPAGNTLYVSKVSMFIQKMICVAGYDLRSLRAQFQDEGRDRVGRQLADRLFKYEAALPNGVTIRGIVDMTIDFLSGNEQRNSFKISNAPPPFFEGYPLPNLSRPPPMTGPPPQDRRGPSFRRMSDPPPWEPPREKNFNMNVMGSIQDQVCRAVDDRFQPYHRHFMDGGFESRNHLEQGHQGRGFQNFDNYERRGFDSRGDFGGGDGGFGRKGEDARNLIRSRSPWRSRSPVGGRGDLRGRLPSKNSDGVNRKVERKDLDKEMDEWRREKERMERKNGRDDMRGHKGKNLEKSLDAELDRLAAKRNLIKKKKEAGKDVEVVDLDLPKPCAVIDPSEALNAKKKLPEDEDIDCITLD